MSNSFLFNMVKKANKTARVEAVKNPQYLINAESYESTFYTRSGEEMTKICVRGTDAISTMHVAGIELHGPAWSGIKDRVVLSTYIRVHRDKDTKEILGEYHHAAGFIDFPENEFNALVDAKKAELSGQADTDDSADI